MAKKILCKSILFDNENNQCVIRQIKRNRRTGKKVLITKTYNKQYSCWVSLGQQRAVLN